MSFKNNAAVRLLIVATIVLLMYLGGKYGMAGLGLEPRGVEMPNWTFADMPLELGVWRGERADDMDPNIVKASEAAPETVVNRVYRDDRGHVISMHTAMFASYHGGAYHTPMACYQASGWENLDETRESLEVTKDLTIPVSVSTWERKGEKLLVVYWYQLGEHMLFNRWDLGMKVRWSLRGRPKWPALIKVMMQIPVRDLEEAKSVMLTFAKQVAVWENQPSHRRWMLGVAAPASSSPTGVKE